jgi:HSP20 family protein
MALPVRRNSSPGAPVARWDPFREFEELQSRTGQLMENIWSATGIADGGMWAPPVDIEESDDAWIVEAEVPGVDRDDIHVDVHGNELTISGDIKEKERKGILRRKTRRVGHFEYRVDLPGGLDPERVEASLHNGVLTLRIPKPEGSKSRRIQVRSDD